MEEKKDNIEKPVIKKKKKWLYRTIYVSLSIFILFDIFLFFFATPVLKDYMQEKVLKSTKGLYHINFDKISIEMSTRRIALTNFKIIPDTAVYNKLLIEGKAKSALYQISTNSIELWGLGFYKLFFKHHFKAKEFLIKDPVVYLKKLPFKDKTNSNKNRDFIHEDLFPLIKDYLNILEFKKINIQNGKFNLNLNKDSVRNTTHYGFLTIKLDNFILNQKEFKSNTRLFYADDIRISIDDYRLKLSDGIHILFADSIVISTKESLLKIISSNIKPIIELPQYLSKLKNNYYYLNISEIKLRNFNMYNLYFNKDIEIQNIIIDSSEIKYISKLKSKKTSTKKELNEIDIYKLIKNKLNSIKIGTLEFKKTDFELYHNSHLNDASYKINNLDLRLYDFALDEYSKDDLSRILYSKNIRLDIDNFSGSLMKNSHSLTTGKIKLYTDTKNLSIENVRIHPIKNKVRKPQLINIRLNNVSIENANFYKLFHKKEFKIGTLKADNSSTIINIFKGKKETKNKKANIVSKLTSSFIKSLYINLINVKKARFQIKTYKTGNLINKQKGEINLNLTSFYIDNANSNKKSRVFHSDKFSIELLNYSQNLKDNIHLLKVDNLYMSSSDSILKLSLFSISPQADSINKLRKAHKLKLLNINIKHFTASGINLDKAFNNKQLIVKDISIIKPTYKVFNFIDIKNDSILTEEPVSDSLKTDSLLISKTLRKTTIVAILSNYFKNIDIGRFSFNKGSFRLLNIDSLNKKETISRGDISASIKQFKYDSDIEIDNYGFANSENFQFELNNFYQKISDNKYQLKIKKLRLSTIDSTFSAEIIRFFPTPNYDDSLYNNLIWTFYSPKFETKGLNIAAYINKNILDFGLIKLTNPSIALVKQKNDKLQKEKDKNGTKNKSKFPFDKIITDSIIIVDGAFGILQNKFDLKNQIFNTTFNLHLSGFQIDSNSIKNPKELFKSINTTVQLQNFHYLLSNSNDLVNIQNFYLDSKNETIVIDSIDYLSFNNNLKKSKLKVLQIPSIQFKGFSYSSLIDKNMFSDSISISNPQIFYSLYENEKKNKTNPLDINIYQKTKKIFNKINISHIKINDASLKIENNKELYPKITEYNNICGVISDLIIDSTNQNNNNQLFNTSDIAFKIKDYKIETKNKLYKINIDELGFSTKLKRIYANLISMTPRFERDALAKTATNQIKLIYFKLNNLFIDDFNFRSFISDQKIIAKQVNINNLKLHSYKNKQFPLDSTIKQALPFNYLFDIDNYIKIDTIKLNNSYIGVEILGKNSTEPGYFDITKLNAIISGLSNDKELINNGLILKTSANGRIMDEGLLTASFRFPLNSQYGEYFYGGRLDSMKMTAFNPLLENLFFVSIRDGFIDSLNFNISANDDFSEGKMRFRYSNLKFDIRNKKKSDSLIVSNRGLASLAANSIVRDNNPRHKNSRLKEGVIYSERDIYHSIFHYWTMSVLSGIKSTMGFKSKELKERVKLEKIMNKRKLKSDKKKSKIKRKERKKYQKEIKNELTE